MRLVCEVVIPDDADYTTKLDAMAQAARDESLWREVKTRDERRDEMMCRTDLDNKCGSCRFFEPETHKRCKSYGKCSKGYPSPRPRSYKACKKYERRKGE